MARRRPVEKSTLLWAAAEPDPRLFISFPSGLERRRCEKSIGGKAWKQFWLCNESDPAFSLKEKIQAGGDGDEHHPDARVSPLPIEFRHVFEIHPIYAGDKC